MYQLCSCILCLIRSNPMPLLNQEVKEKDIFFDSLVIPSAIRNRSNDVAVGLGIPPEITAVLGLAVVGGSISNKCSVNPMHHMGRWWDNVPNLWSVIVAPPGSNKSAAIDSMIEPYLKEHIELDEKFKQEYSEYLSDKKKFDITYKEFVKKKKFDPDVEEPKMPVAPKQKELIVDDASYEAIGELLNNSDQGLISKHDELTELFGTMDKNARNATGARGFFLGAWNGNIGKKINRIGRGSFYVKNLCLSVIGGIQPKMLTGIVDKVVSGENADGLLERFQLMVAPKFSSEYHMCTTPENLEYKRVYGQMVLKLLTVDPLLLGAKEGIDGRRKHFIFSKEASDLYFKWDRERHYAADATKDSFGGVLSASKNKQQALMSSLAMIFHLVEIATGILSPSYEIDVINVEKAIKLTGFLEEHLIKVLNFSNAEDDRKGDDIHDIIYWCRNNKQSIEDGMLTPSKIAHKINKNKFNAAIVKEAISDFVVKWEGRKIVELKF